jgi:AraC-like DNA-binding protein
MYNLSFDTRILSTIKDIELTGGNITLDALCSKSKLSSKQLERLFIIHVGLTPKKFTRIVRFFHIHRKLSHEGIANLCYKVLQHGYYDQAHFNREYKLLTGLTPTSEIMSIFYNTKD